MYELLITYTSFYLGEIPLSNYFPTITTHFYV